MFQDVGEAYEILSNQGGVSSPAPAALSAGSSARSPPPDRLLPLGPAPGSCPGSVPGSWGRACSCSCG